MLKELEVPPDPYYNISMLNMKEIKYKELLDLEWQVKRSTIHAQSKYDEYYQAYGKHDKDDLLTSMAYDELKSLRQAKKTLTKVIEVMRDNDLYTYSD